MEPPSAAGGACGSRRRASTRRRIPRGKPPPVPAARDPAKIARILDPRQRRPGPMKTTAVTTADFERSVLAVPPIARRPDFSLDEEANHALIRHLEAGGIRTLMYGGNANFYHLGLSDLEAAARQLIALAGAETWIIPSIGPEYGKALDQARLLAEIGFPTVMVLPASFPLTPAGVAIGLRKIAERFGRPIIAYVKTENYARPADLGALVRDGLVSAIKYGVVRKEPAADAYL